MANETERTELSYEGVLSETATVGWVVHEVMVPTGGQGVWAWCRVEMDRPGYSEIYFTKRDGQTVAERPAGELRLGARVFQAWC